MKKVMQYIKILVFGYPVKGEPLPKPNFKTTEVINRPTENEWVKEFKFGSRYGTRGSFYNNN